MYLKTITWWYNIHESFALESEQKMVPRELNDKKMKIYYKKIKESRLL